MSSDKIIFGIDITKGSPGAKQTPRYAVAISSNGHMEHHRMVSRHKLMRMIRQQRPAILAVDNIHELTSSRRDMISFMRKLPQGTRLVQVTGGEHLEPLVGLARTRGITFDRFDPIQEAQACATLAAMDVGAEVSVFEDKTYIKVSRARSPGRGGWSQNRYRRKVHGNVRQKTREIEDTLRVLNREKGINYTSSIVKGYGGYTRGEFLIDVPRSDIPISSVKSGDVQVKVQEVERDAIQFKSLKEQKRKYIIAGVDPGTTTGLALLDLQGRLVKLHSGRGMSVPDIIEMITQNGRPLVIASDVKPIPGTVEKIRRSFNAISGEPDESLTLEDKINLAKPYGYNNDHERDALGAAASFYRHNKNKFDQIKKRVPPGLDTDEVIARVMRGETIDSAVANLSGKEEKQEQKVETKPVKETKRITELTGTIKRQQDTIESLRTYLEELQTEIEKKKHIIKSREEKIRSLKAGTYSKIRKYKELRIRENRIRQLKSAVKEKDGIIGELKLQVEELKQVRSLEISGRTTPVKVVQGFTREAIANTAEQYGINPGDVLFFKDASGGGPAGVDILADLQVRAVIFSGEPAHNAVEEFYKRELPFISVKSLAVQYVDDFGVVDPEELNTLEKYFKEEIEAKKKKEKEHLLDKLVEEYKSERRKGKI
jgi:predicted RNase H-like nuclease (RuvC/YqgF family)